MSLFDTLVRDTVAADTDIREGRFQRALSLIAGLSSILSGLEVAYEHYRGSYGQKVMYWPVIISPVLFVAGVWGTFSKRAAKTVLPAVSGATLLVCLAGFGFHVRGITRKPGGWRLPVANLIMGPPIFAPLLFGIAGYLGLMAAFLRRTDAPADPSVHPAVRPLQTLFEMGAVHSEKHSQKPQSSEGPGSEGWEQNLREGRYQKHLAAMAAAASLFNGIEALYSHYKNNYRYWVQWTPVASSLLLTLAGIATVFSKWAGKVLLPITSLLAILNGAMGFYFHLRGVLRRPGGLKKPLYNIMYGPPIFAPLLLAAAGAMGLLACLMRREK
ncbi:MAG: hypothetical protein M3Y13_06085 [Armatimonadota bacterium]|nr:hypothetical protein [Armatimonadota bacterium]